MHSAQELVCQIEALTSVPTVYDRVREQLDSPEGSVSEVARLVAADPALTARLLRLVNSAMYGYRSKIDNVGRAVQILGLQQVHDLVLAMSLHAMFAGVRPARLDMRRFWRNSVLCGLAARAVARLGQRSATERLFVIGLLADIGHLVMYQTTPSLAAEAHRVAGQTGEPLDAAERRIVGCDFAEVGATLMDHWHLPPAFSGAIGAQTLPRLGGDYSNEAAVLNLASSIVRADETGEPSNDAASNIETGIWSQLDLDPACFAAIREDAELHLATYVAVFFPSTSR